MGVRKLKRVAIASSHLRLESASRPNINSSSATVALGLTIGERLGLRGLDFLLDSGQNETFHAAGRAQYDVQAMYWIRFMLCFGISLLCN